MTEGNSLAKLNRIKRAERLQLAADEPEQPTLEQFWSQPRGVRLIFIESDVLDHVPSMIVERGFVILQQKISNMAAYPAHVGTLLSRRRRGRWSVAYAAWFSKGWTKVQGTIGEAISTDEQQISFVAAKFGRGIVSLHYDWFNGNVGLIEASACGEIEISTYVTPVLTVPQNPNHHSAVANEPNARGLTLALGEAGLDIGAHVLHKESMITIMNTHGHD